MHLLTRMVTGHIACRICNQKRARHYHFGKNGNQMKIYVKEGGSCGATRQKTQDSIIVFVLMVSTLKLVVYGGVELLPCGEG